MELKKTEKVNESINNIVWRHAYANTWIFYLINLPSLIPWLKINNDKFDTTETHD